MTVPPTPAHAQAHCVDETVATVFDATGYASPVSSPDDIARVLADEPGAFVWLDVVDADARYFAQIQERFGLHPLAIEDALHSHQRPKIEAYGDTWFVVAYAATRREDQLVLHEVAVFVGRRFAITVRAEPGYPLDEFRRRCSQQRMRNAVDGATFLHTLLDTIVDGYAPIGEAFEDQVEQLEAALLGDGKRTRDVLLEIFEMKKNLATLRRAVVPLRDILVPIMRGDIVLFKTDAEELPYYRDVFDHLARVSEQLDATRDLINNARDTHIALDSNRQNEVSKQLTVVATIFLPLTFVTGFFGQNFGFLTEHMTTAGSFWWFGVGSEIAALGGLLTYFRFKRWF